MLVLHIADVGSIPCTLYDPPVLQTVQKKSEVHSNRNCGNEIQKRLRELLNATQTLMCIQVIAVDILLIWGGILRCDLQFIQSSMPNLSSKKSVVGVMVALFIYLFILIYCQATSDLQEAKVLDFISKQLDLIVLG